MVELELRRSPGERRLYEISGVGTLRFEGFFSRRVTAEAAADAWSFARTRFWRSTINASDASGTVVGSFDPRTIRRGGSVRWQDRDLELRPASMWRERYALADHDRELAVFDATSWGKRPVKITLDEHSLVEPGLLLFAAFIVRELGEDADAAATVIVTTG
jgi:hypothetical protein